MEVSRAEYGVQHHILPEPILHRFEDKLVPLSVGETRNPEIRENSLSNNSFLKQADR